MRWLAVLCVSCTSAAATDPDTGRPDSAARDAAVDAASDEDASFLVADTPFARVDNGLDWLQWNETYPVPCYLTLSSGCAAMLFTGGVAIRDVDLDGDLDVYATRMDETDILFVNDGSGQFTEATPAGLGEVWLSNGAAFADADNDGDPDLLVGSVGEEQFYFYVNNGRGEFQETAGLRGIAAEDSWKHATMSLCWGDYNLDGNLDAHTTEWRPPNFEVGTSHNSLFENRGGGFFRDRTEDLGVSMLNVGRGGAYGFTSHLIDIDGNRYPELLVAADYGSSRLFWNDEGTFMDGTVAAGVGTDENGMGSAIGDLDGDGMLEWFVTAVYGNPCEEGEQCRWGSSGNRAYAYEGDRVFSDQTDAMGLRVGDWGWGAHFFDFDLDGDLDVVATSGMPEDYLFPTPRVRLWRNDDGVFTDVAEELGIRDDDMGRAVVPFDADGDGDEDLLVTHTLGRPTFWQNNATEDRAWLVVQPRGTQSNRDGVGAVVRVWATEDAAPMLRHAGNGCGFLGHTPGTPHFGLGEVEVAHRVEVYWPLSDQTQIFEDVPARQVFEVVEPE
ncbi:MAG: CRTAC1 family protein [Myxococcota bacterium]